MISLELRLMYSYTITVQNRLNGENVKVFGNNRRGAKGGMCVPAPLSGTWYLLFLNIRNSPESGNG